jgi:hypothetical protein
MLFFAPLIERCRTGHSPITTTDDITPVQRVLPGSGNQHAKQQISTRRRDDAARAGKSSVRCAVRQGSELASRIQSTLTVLLIASMVSGCSVLSIEEKVPLAELEAERERRVALEAQEQDLRARLADKTALVAEVEQALAIETSARQALVQRQAELEQDLKAQHVTHQALRRLEARWEQWRAEDLSRSASVDDFQRLESQWERWRAQDAKQQSSAIHGREEEEARFRLMLLEKTALIASLNQQLEQTILEVVRTKAKLRSVESRAEAASELAESEIAVESLASQGERWKSDPILMKAAQLNELGAREFEQANYGGTLYLTGQAKGLINSTQARSLNQQSGPTVDGEVPFVMPLRLKLLGASNVREGPGTHFETLFTETRDAALTGYAYLGSWVRVQSQDGRNGWVYYKMLKSAD